jgi:radical SAM protein with 4Fe4S-binding SPASM domain
MPTRHLGWIGGWRPDDFGALSKQLQAVCKRAIKTKGPGAVIIPHVTSERDLERYYTDHSATFGFNKCTAIHRAVELNANGDVSLCRDYHDYVIGNVKTHTVTQLWNNEPARKFRRSLNEDGLMPACTRCCGLMGN